MTKGLSFSNGEFFVGLDEKAQVACVSYPHIGSEIHTTQNKHRIGIWVDNQLSWTDDAGWEHKLKLPYGALVGHSVLTNKDLGIVLELEDFVDSKDNVLIRNLHIINIRNDQRQVHLFVHQAFNIKNSLLEDTVQFLPKENAILHHQGDRVFLASGRTDIGSVADQHSVGVFGDGLDGTWKDAEDGYLEGGNSDQGQTDSVLRFSLTIGGLSSRRANYWLCAATSIPEAITLHKPLIENGVAKKLESTTLHWRRWMDPALKASKRIEPKHRIPFINSLGFLKSHSDKDGAIISNFANSQEAYCSPKEAAYAVWPMLRLGYYEEAINFFDFCKQNLTSEGSLMRSYRADGVIAGSTLPYHNNLPPVDIDDITAVILVFAQFYAVSKKKKLINEYYDSLIKPLANFLSDHTTELGLPMPSFNGSSRKKLTKTYTICSVYASLNAAADLADITKDQTSTIRWRTSAETLGSTAQKLVVTEDGIVKGSVEQPTLEISGLYGAFMFGMFDINSQVISQTVKSIEGSLRSERGLFTKSAASSDIDYLGSLWMAQYYMEIDKSDDASQTLSSVSADALSGQLGTNSLWVQAELCNTLLDTLAYSK